MNDLLDDILEIKANCVNAQKIFKNNDTKKIFDSLEKSNSKIAESWSGSWIGYQAYIYYINFSPHPSNDIFSIEWGMQSAFNHPASANWVQYNYDEVLDAILNKANISKKEVDDFEKSLSNSQKLFQELKTEFITLIEISFNENQNKLFEKLLKDATKLKLLSQNDFVNSLRPTQFVSRDSLAVSQGLKTPPHIAFQTFLLSLRAIDVGLESLFSLVKKTEVIINKSTEGTSMEPENSFVFIGHGHSNVWKDLKDFLQDRLKLKWEEFNREPTAGYSTSERLQEMLNSSKFAFIIMTAEDEHSDGNKHARENVIHEVGLFQGKLGFKKAIVLLEDGCVEFSNIIGLGQIRFPKENIEPKFEEIRKVLEREKIIH